MTQQAGSSGITSDDKLWAALGYPIPLIALIMLFIEDKRKRPFIKFHAVQALALVVAIIAIEILAGILQAILSAVHIGFLGVVFSCLLPFLWLVLFWPAILAFQGKYVNIPFVTKFTRDQHWVA